jgi:ABC-type uncharacterized transport system substrate-binding protein
MRRIGMLIGLAENDPEGKILVDTLRTALKALDWVEGENIRIDRRFAPAGIHADTLARELVALKPDVILTFSTPATAAVKQIAGAIPIVFLGIADNADAITRAIDNFAEAANGGLLVLPNSTTNLHRDLIIALAAKHRLPAVYTNRFFVTGGGLMSYGVSWIHEFRQAASYVDRILRGTKPADLPVQAATKFVTVLNVRTAKALGKAVPASLVVAADEVIE